MIVLGFILGVVGAIMRYAVTVRTPGFNIHDAGVILLVAGILVLLLGLVVFAVGTRSRSTTVENVQSSPSGEKRVEERSEWSA